MMDISETYIKMCDHPFIQGQWEPKEGDVYIGRESRFFSIYAGACIDFINSDDVWLPRQDQIQLKLVKKYDHPSTMIMYFSLFVNNKEMFEGLYGDSRYTLSLESQEQFWLAYYMHENHKKQWTDKKWK